MDVKKELSEAIGAMSLRVKFELLHDEVPQVRGWRTWASWDVSVRLELLPRGSSRLRGGDRWRWKLQCAESCRCDI